MWVMGFAALMSLKLLRDTRRWWNLPLILCCMLGLLPRFLAGILSLVSCSWFTSKAIHLCTLSMRVLCCKQTNFLSKLWTWTWIFTWTISFQAATLLEENLPDSWSNFKTIWVFSAVATNSICTCSTGPFTRSSLWQACGFQSSWYTLRWNAGAYPKANH